MSSSDAYAITLPAVLPPDNNTALPLCELTWILFGASTLLIAGRLISKIFVLKRLGSDDTLMLLAWICVGVYSVAVQLASNGGLGRHYEYLSVDGIYSLFRWVYVALGFCIIGPMLGRLSFVVYLLAILGKSRHAFRYPLWIILVLQICFNVACVLTIYAACGINVPTMMSPETTCFRRSPWARFSQFVGSLNVFSDATLTMIPTLLVAKMKTTMSAKCAATALLSLSSLAMAACIWRTLEIGPVFSRDLDFTWGVVPFLEASALEQNIIIISASVPTLGPIVGQLRRKWRKTPYTTSTAWSQQSEDNHEIQHNFAQALGMRLPGLGHTTAITAGPSARDSQEHILPLSNLSAAIKTTRRTEVKVEYMDRSEELCEQQSPVQPEKGFRC